MNYGLTRQEALTIVKLGMAKTEYANLLAIIARVQELKKDAITGYADESLGEIIKRLQDAKTLMHEYIFLIEGRLPDNKSI